MINFKRNIFYKIERFLFPHLEEADNTCSFFSRWLRIIIGVPFMLSGWVAVAIYERKTKLKHIDFGNDNIDSFNKSFIGMFFIRFIALFITFLLGIYEFGNNPDNSDAIFDIIARTEPVIVYQIILYVFLFGTVILGIVGSVIFFFSLGMVYMLLGISKFLNKYSFSFFKDERVQFSSMFIEFGKFLKQKVCSKIYWFD